MVRARRAAERQALAAFMTIDPLTHTALAYREALAYRGNIEFLDISFDVGTSNETIVRVARLCLPCSDESTLWLSASVGVTIPAELQVRHHFVALGSTASPLLPTLVAETFHFEHFVEQLGLDHTFPLGPRSKFRHNGYSHALLITPTFGISELSTPSGIIHLLQVVPITASEHQLKTSAGIDALLAAWEADSKDVSVVDLPLH